MSRGHPRLYDSDHSPNEQTRALRADEAPVAAYGLRKMSFPLAAVYAHATGNVIGVDIGEDVIGGVDDGECHVMKKSGLLELVAERAERGALRATTNGVAVAEGAAVYVAIVPAPLTDDREPDLAAFEVVLDSITRGLAPGDFAVVECIVPPGTSKDLVVPHLADRGDLLAGEFGVAFCPERTSSGRVLRDITESHPEVIGGVDTESTRVATLVYGEITANEVIPVRDATAAGAVKLLEGVYHGVNIALANELARLHDDLGIDVAEAVDVTDTQPYCDIHAPGPGISGYCIPWYSYFITSRVAVGTPLFLTARGVNDSVPTFTADKLRDEPAMTSREIRGATVAILDIVYRPDVAETRAIPAAGVIDRLNDLGATILAANPMLSDEVVASFDATPVSLSDLPNHAIDAAVIVTPHEEFDGIGWAAFDGLVVVDDHGTLDDIGHRVYETGGGPRGESSETEAGPEITADSSHGRPGR